MSGRPAGTTNTRGGQRRFERQHVEAVASSTASPCNESGGRPIGSRIPVIQVCVVQLASAACCVAGTVRPWSMWAQHQGAACSLCLACIHAHCVSSMHPRSLCGTWLLAPCSLQVWRIPDAGPGVHRATSGQEGAHRIAAGQYLLRDRLVATSWRRACSHYLAD